MRCPLRFNQQTLPSSRVLQPIAPNLNIPSIRSMEVQRSSPGSTVPPLIYRITIAEEPTLNFLEELKQSVFLQASTPISPADLLVHLCFCHPGPWVIRMVGDTTFLVQGPESWRLTVIAHEFTVFGSQRFIISTDFASLYGRTKPEQFWIKIFNLDFDLRGPGVLCAIIQPFVRLLDLDTVFSSRIELRWARVLVEVVARELIPPVGWFEL
jgi:hypothetical protein